MDESTKPADEQLRDQIELDLMNLGERMLQWFKFSHLPPKLQKASWPYAVLAIQLVKQLPQNAERTVALRKLLESKDCAVRALLETTVSEPTRAGSVR